MIVKRGNSLLNLANAQKITLADSVTPPDKSDKDQRFRAAITVTWSPGTEENLIVYKDHHHNVAMEKAVTTFEVISKLLEENCAFYELRSRPR